MVKVKTAATIGFIGAVAIAGLAVGLQPTVIDGRVMAADLLPQLRHTNPRLIAMECDRRIPIGNAGTTFECVLHEAEAPAVHLEYTMDRSGALAVRLVGR